MPNELPTDFGEEPNSLELSAFSRFQLTIRKKFRELITVSSQLLAIEKILIAPLKTHHSANEPHSPKC